MVVTSFVFFVVGLLPDKRMIALKSVLNPAVRSQGSTNRIGKIEA
jgi:hypothetical protein